MDRVANPIKKTFIEPETPSPRKVLQGINDAYNERLKQIMSGSNKDLSPLDLGRPSPCLLAAGIPNLPIQMSVQRLHDKKGQENHMFSLLSVIHMPEALYDPVAIFKSKTRPGEIMPILTDMEDKNINLIVAVEMSKICGRIEVNSVRSIYPKDNFKDVLRWIVEENLMVYCQKEKILNWLGKQQSNLADVTQLIEDSTKLVNEFENPNII